MLARRAGGHLQIQHSTLKGELMDHSSVVVLSAASGAGHIRAADAMVKAFASREIVAKQIEALKFTSALFRKVYSDLYIELVNKRPEILGWVYDSTDKPWKYQKRRLALDLLNTQPLVRLLRQERPDMALCTHFLPAEILSHLKRKKILDMPIGIVVTDLDAHAMWLYRDIDFYFVAIDETKIYLEKMGIDPARVHVTGIPIDPVFAEQKNRQELRARFGLDQNMTTVLISVGGFGVGPLAALLRSLDDMKNAAQFIVICGRNEKLKQSLQPMRTKHKMHIVGFTTEMDAYMSASDLLVGKAGGLTTSEALAKGLVPVIVNPVPGQEERNSDHLLEAGVAIRCNNLPALGYKVDKLLDDQPRWIRMKKAAVQFGRPHAADDIARIVAEGLAGKNI
jgi:processive 1,2-diacylglycerol beta-glucosyltransferase